MLSEGEMMNVCRYSLQKGDELLFDTNIWVRLYGPQGKSNDPATNAYSNLLSKAMGLNCKIYIDAFILSEFINVFARYRHKFAFAADPTLEDFKVYRKTVQFKPVAQEIAACARQIVRKCVPIDFAFSDISIPDFLDMFECGECDFNDQVIASICETRNLILVTHDGDFDGYKIKILTENITMLQKYKNEIKRERKIKPVDGSQLSTSIF